MVKKNQIIEKKQEFTPVIKYNNLTEQSYLEHGFDVPQTLDGQEKYFLSLVDTTKGPIEKTVTKIVRLKAIDHNSTKKERKEFLMWYENWYGNDWQGVAVPPVTDHVEGRYQKQSKQNVVKNGRVTGYTRGPETTVYYVPFSKAKVDEIINSSIGTDKETIKFVVNDGIHRNDSYSYDQFVNSTFEECIRLMMTAGGPELAMYAGNQTALLANIRPTLPPHHPPTTEKKD